VCHFTTAFFRAAGRAYPVLTVSFFRAAAARIKPGLSLAVVVSEA